MSLHFSNHKNAKRLHYFKHVNTYSFSTAVHIYNFHIFTIMYSPLGGFIWSQPNDQLLVGLLAQFVERCTSIAKVMGSNPVGA